MPSCYLISRNGEPIAAVRWPADIEAALEGAPAGKYDVDVLHDQERDGATSWRWGAATRQWNGRVEVNREG